MSTRQTQTVPIDIDADFLATMAADRTRIILANARRISARRWRGSPNWVIASEVFGLGSTYAHMLCRRIGVDPHGKTGRSLLSQTEGAR